MGLNYATITVSCSSKLSLTMKCSIIVSGVTFMNAVEYELITIGSKNCLVPIVSKRRFGFDLIKHLTSCALPVMIAYGYFQDSLCSKIQCILERTKTLNELRINSHFATNFLTKTLAASEMALSSADSSSTESGQWALLRTGKIYC